MLIIAMPKSASSTLISTLCKLHNITDETRNNRNNYLTKYPVAKDYFVFVKQHSELHELQEDVIKHLSSPLNLTKHHIPPTQNNQRLLENCRKVVILREPIEIIKAYKRGDDAGVFPMRNIDFAFCFSEKAWIQKAYDIGLIEELKNFYDGWLEHSGNKIIVHYKDIVEQPKKTLNRIERYFDLSVSGYIELEREKYTRSASMNPERNMFTFAARTFFRRRNKIIKRVLRDVLRFLGLLDSIQKLRQRLEK